MKLFGCSISLRVYLVHGESSSQPIGFSSIAGTTHPGELEELKVSLQPISVCNRFSAPVQSRAAEGDPPVSKWLYIYFV